MIDYVSILHQYPNGVLATQDGEGVHTRVFQFQFTQGGKIYFCTQGFKPVYSQLIASPNVSFCSCALDFDPVLSINGRAIFTEDIDLKTRVINENPLIKDIYQTPDNPVFKLFYIDVKEVKTFSFAEGSKSYKI